MFEIIIKNSVRYFFNNFNYIDIIRMLNNLSYSLGAAVIIRIKYRLMIKFDFFCIIKYIIFFNCFYF